jgi:hypothetical protein
MDDSHAHAAARGGLARSRGWGRPALAAAALAAVAGAAAAQPAPPAPGRGSGSAAEPPAPSTGRELAPERRSVIAGEQAKLARQLIAGGACPKSMERAALALAAGRPELSRDELVKGHLLVQRCAGPAKAWAALRESSQALLALAPDQSSPDQLIRALLELDLQAEAAAMLKVLAKRFPERRADLTIAVAQLACHRKQYQRCFDAATAMSAVLADLRGTPAELFEARAKNRLFRSLAAVALGRLDVYEAEVAALAALAREAGRPPGEPPWREQVAQVRRDGGLFLAETSPILPLGTYHYMASGKHPTVGALATVRMIPHQRARKLRIEVGVPGVTEVHAEVVAVPAGKQLDRAVSPPLSLSLDVAKLRAPRTGQLRVKVADAGTGALVLEKSYPVEILPRDHLPLAVSVGSDSRRRAHENALAWITPNAPEIDPFLAAAKARAPGRTLSGLQAATVPQVRALFDELKARGVSYVMDPDVFSTQLFAQRTRLPAEVLATTNAQCLEGTLLLATLLEAIGIEPILAFVPGHAFVGWRTSPRFDRGLPPVVFLETTMVANNTFEAAVRAAMGRFAEEDQLGNFKSGRARLLDVAKLRRAGWKPQPY